MLKVTIVSCFLLSSASVFAYSLPVENLFGSLIGRSGAPADDLTIDQALARVANQINQNLPMEVDKHTRLDKVTHDTNRQLTYHYTLITMRSSDVDKANFQKAMQPHLKKKLCDSGEMKSFLKNGVSITYAYRGSDVQPIGSFKYSPTECGYKIRRGSN